MNHENFFAPKAAPRYVFSIGSLLNDCHGDAQAEAEGQTIVAKQNEMGDGALY